MLALLPNQSLLQCARGRLGPLQLLQQHLTPQQVLPKQAAAERRVLGRLISRLGHEQYTMGTVVRHFPAGRFDASGFSSHALHACFEQLLIRCLHACNASSGMGWGTRLL
jgi:hypothetical protein